MLETTVFLLTSAGPQLIIMGKSSLILKTKIKTTSLRPSFSFVTSVFFLHWQTFLKSCPTFIISSFHHHWTPAVAERLDPELGRAGLVSICRRQVALSLAKAFRCLIDSAVMWGWCLNSLEGYSKIKQQDTLIKCLAHSRWSVSAPDQRGLCLCLLLHQSHQAGLNWRLCAIWRAMPASSLWLSLYHAVLIFPFSIPAVAPSDSFYPLQVHHLQRFLFSLLSCSPWQPRHIKGFNC